jgi:hypothetical protein
MIRISQGSLTASFPRKRESRGGKARHVALDPRVRGGDDALRVRF